MGGLFIPVCGPIVANTLYCNKTLAAKNVGITLPEVTPATADIEAMGTFTLPVWARIENMAFTVTYVGVDYGLQGLVTPGVNDLEARFIQQVTDESGKTSEVGFKAFVKGMCTKLPGISLAVGERSENECEFNILRYQMYMSGKEMWLIDRLAGIVRINGVDMTAKLNSLL